MFNLDKTSTDVAIMSIDAYRITDHDILGLYEKYKKQETVWDHIFEFTINENNKANNQPIIAAYYHQFTGQVVDKEPKEYICFNVNTVDDLLDEEISQCGVEDLFQGIDFKRLLNTSYIKPYDSYFQRLSRPQYFLVELEYMCQYDNYGGGYEYEMEIDIIGYLDDKYNKILFKNEDNKNG